jgi:hypothetical protein
MTKISTYVVDEKVTSLDKWIGSDANMQNKTKNFTPKKLAAYFNDDQVINIGTPLQYKYYTLDPLESRPNGTITFETEIGPTVNFSSITTFLLSKYTTKQNIVSDFLNFLDGSKVLLFKSSDINSFGFYRISSIEPYEADPNFFVVTVDYETGNGFMQEDNDYMLSLVSLPGGAIPTKTSELINDGEDGVHPFISEEDINRAEWDAAYEGKINSAEVTGTTTKTLTLNKQDGSTIEASWTDDNTDSVTSVFGRDGDVVAQVGDYTTDQVTEVADKKYQTDNQALFNDATSSIQTQLNSKEPSITAGTTAQYYRGDKTFQTLNTSAVPEGANLYLTNSRVIESLLTGYTPSSGAITPSDSILTAIEKLSGNVSSGYVPYTGATNDLILGSHYLSADHLKISTTSTESVDVGEIVWNQQDGTFDMGLIAGVTLQAGQEMHIYGKASEAIANGDAIMFAGVQGDHILIAKAEPTAINANPEYFIGIATQDFTVNQFGYTTVFGMVRTLDTASYPLGSILYYASNISASGELTTIRPDAPNAKITVAAVLKSHANQGILMVRPHVMPKIKDLQDVYAPSPTNGQGLFWNNSNSRYENSTIPSALGYTPVTDTRTLTINGTTYDLTANRTWTIPTHDSVTIGTANGLSLSGQQLSLGLASSSTNGALSSSDWITFNNKQAAGNYITSLTGEVTASGPGAASATLNNASVTAKILSGVNITGGTIVDTDTMLTAFGKLQNQINSLIGGSIYQGVWNANTNTPTLTSSVGVDGNYYIVNVAGSTDLNGITDWKVGDWAIFHGGTWQKVDNTDAVSSVNGFTGAVSLTTDNISEGATNQYFLNSRARVALSFTAGSGAYNSTTGVITIPTNNNQITNGAGYITLGSLSASAPIQYSNTTGAISITQASGSTNGYLSSTDWTTFNNKANDNNVVHLTGNQSIDGIKTFISGNTTWDNSSNNLLDFYISNVRKGSIYVNSSFFQFNAINSGGYIFKNSASNNSLTINDSGNAAFLGSVTASSIIKSGGTSSQFLKADGSIDSTSYQPLLTNPITGTGTTNYLPKFTGSTALGNSLIYDNGTNVGIGTTSPSTLLHLNAGASNDTNLRVQSGAAGNHAKLTFSNSSNTVFWTAGYRSGTGDFGINYGDSFNSTGLTINTSGNVGIGTSSPVEKFVVSNGGSQGLEITPNFNSTTNRILSYNRGSSVYNTLLYDGVDHIWNTSSTERMRITSGGNVGIGTTSPSEKLSVIGGNISLGAGYKLQYSSTAYMTPENNVSGAEIATGGVLTIKTGGTTERVRVDASGNVGIGTTSPAEKLQVAGNVLATGFFQSSDLRLKDIISRDGDVIKYKWKDKRDDKIHIGYVAQAIREVMPDAVNEGADGMLSVNYVEVLVAKIEMLENRIKQLENGLE